MIIDTHAHYDDESFDEDREELLASLGEAGITKAVTVCASIESLESAAALAERYPFLYLAAGIHPDDAPRMGPEVYDRIRTLARQEKTVVIGEIGLDYYWHKEEENHILQQEVFVAQMDLAREEGLPFMVHSRDACADTLRLCKEAVARGNTPGIIHCYSYSWEAAREFLSLGFCLGIGGVVTYKNGRKLKEVVANAPLEQLVLETDCPYLSPVPFRGKRNSSLHLPYVVKEIAALKGITPQEVEEATWENAHRILPRLGRTQGR